MRVLVVEDSRELASYMVSSLQEAGYAADLVANGTAGLRHVQLNPPDVVILDRMLPGMDGVAVLRALRMSGCSVPVLMLTALGEPEDCVTGLDAGADDYLVKPFDLAEMLARVRALLRRPQERLTVSVAHGDLEIDTDAHAVRCAGELVALTAKEYAILEYLVRNPGRVVSRSELLEHCWEFNYNPFSNITDVYIRRIRKKLHDDGERYIETVRGVGYRIRE